MRTEISLPVVIGQVLVYDLSFLQGTKPEIGINAIQKLMDTVDATIPVPEHDLKSPPYIPIEKTYSIPGRGKACIFIYTVDAIYCNRFGTVFVITLIG